MKRTWLMALAIGTSLLGARGASAGTPSWRTLSPLMNSSKRPAVTRGRENSIGKVQVYGVDINGQIVNFNINATSRDFTATPLGGLTQKAPTAIEWTNHRQVLVVGNDNLSLWRNISLNEGPFGGWQQVLGPPPGTSICSDPSAASWGLNRIDLYVVGCDGTLRHAWTNNGNWAWDNRGAPAGGLATDPGPQVVSPTGITGRLDVWVKHFNGILWDNEYASSTFTWRQTNLQFVNDFAAAPFEITPRAVWFDTTGVVGVVRNGSAPLTATTTQPGVAMHNSQILNTGPFSTVALTKYDRWESVMYGLVNGRVQRRGFSPQVNGTFNGTPTTPAWDERYGQDLFNTGKVLNGKIATIAGWDHGQNAVFLFGYEGNTLVSATDTHDQWPNP